MDSLGIVPHIIEINPEASQYWMATRYPERKRMQPKTRDHLAIAIGSAGVLYALQQKKNAKITVLAAIGGAVALWAVSRWENAE